MRTRRPGIRLSSSQLFNRKLAFLTLKYSGDIFRRETRRREVFIRIRQFE
jgi:hypothetical protein